MADETDIASEYEEVARYAMIEESHRKASVKINKSKHCLNCHEPTTGGVRFCNKDCMDDFQKRIKR